MSKPLTMTQNAEEGDRTTIRLRIERHADDGIVQAILAQRAWDEVDALRAALAAAEAKLAEVVNRCGLAELAVTQRDIALADERRHADALYECLRELSGPCEYPEHCARYKHHRCRSCSEAKLIDPLLAAHAARRAAEVANG